MIFPLLLLSLTNLQGAHPLDPIKPPTFELQSFGIPHQLLATPPQSPQKEQPRPIVPKNTTLTSSTPPRNPATSSPIFNPHKAGKSRISKINPDGQTGKYYCHETDKCKALFSVYKNLAIHCTQCHKNKKINTPKKCHTCKRKVSYFSLHPDYCVAIDGTTKKRDKDQSLKRRAKKRQAALAKLIKQKHKKPVASI